MALLEQAEDFYKAAESGVKAAKPLLLYYCFMNLGKAFILTCRMRPSVDDAQHGLSEKIDAPPNNRELTNAYLDSFATAPDNLNNFDELLIAITGSGITTDRRFDLVRLMPQIVAGHRLWVESSRAHGKERFVALEKVEFWKESSGKEIWVRVYLYKDDLKRIGAGHNEALVQSRLDTLLREVACDKSIDERPLICFEQIDTTTYSGRPADNVQALVSTIRHYLWRVILSAPPYRKYYIYLAPCVEHSQVLPQIMSIYAMTFYLGSIVRYRPHHFDRIIDGSFGPFIEAFLNDQPKQFIYLMASEFAEKEVTKAGIV